MSALAHSSGVSAGHYPRLELVWSQPRVQRVPTAVYWVRRLTVAAVAVLLILGAWVAVEKGVQLVASQITSASASVSAAAPSGRFHQVQAGDTLWSVARNAQPRGDIRPLVSRMSADRQGRPLQVGEMLQLPRAG